MKHRDEESFFEIDKNALDKEWEAEPKQAFLYYKEYEEARLKLEVAITAQDVIAAGLSRLIRADPTKYGLAKVPTETSINKIVMLKSNFKEAGHRVQRIQNRVGLLKAATKAIEHKKSALENLVYLHGQNYFSTPRVRGEQANEIVDDMNTSRKKKRRQGSKKSKKSRSSE